MSRAKATRLPIVGAAELQHLLDVSKQRVFQLIADPDYYFPEPWVRLRGAQIWLMDDIEAWAAEQGRTLTPLPADWPPPRAATPVRPRGDAARRSRTAGRSKST